MPKLRERILHAAVQLFSRQGFSATSTRDIARLATVNESSLFRLFTSKADLFWTAVQSQMEHVRLGKELQAGLEQVKIPEIVVPLIVEFMVQVAMFHPELMRLLNIAMLEFPPTAEGIFRQELAPVFQTLCNYLKRCMEAGSLRSVDPALLVYSLASGVVASQSLHGLINGTYSPYANKEEAIAAYRSFWTTLLSTSENASSVAAGV